jgi:predicted DCC family thiol-disulfide oxidoreductase YuxK
VSTALVYDGDCAFCTASVRWVSRLHLRVDEVVPYQFADLAALGLTEQQCAAAVQLVESDRTWSGHEAFGRLLRRSHWAWRPLGAALFVPPTSWLGRALYRWVAAHRHVLPGGTAACVLPAEQRPKAS